jgi:hypothetical protein
MNATQCHREHELLDALGQGFVGAEAPVPAAGTMWWRMQLRRRQEAQAAARRSLVAGQAMTLAIALALAVSFFGADAAAALHDAFTTIAAVRFGTPIVIAAAVLGAWALGAPIAVWVAVRQK